MECLSEITPGMLDREKGNEEQKGSGSTEGMDKRVSGDWKLDLRKKIQRMKNDGKYFTPSKVIRRN